MKKPHAPTRFELSVLDLLKAHTEGLDIAAIRDLLQIGTTQAQLSRRLRALDPHHVIERERRGRLTLYRYMRPRKPGEWDFEEVPKNLRAKMLSIAGGRCQMCGRTTMEDKIKLHIDHRIPRDWGGKTEEDNLWAICSTCNEGKKDYFANFDSGVMREVMAFPSVHRRIAELLRLNLGKWVQCNLIEFVANAQGSQTDWRKRTRELRYFGLKIGTMRKKEGKRTVSYYRLKHWKPIPDDPTAAARKYEEDRAQRNSGK